MGFETIASGVHVMAMLRSFVAVSAVGEVESVTSTVNRKFPSAVGVPEMTPVELLIVSPGGRLPRKIVHVNGAVP